MMVGVVAGAPRRTLRPYPAAVMQDAPLIYWRLGDAPGERVAADASGNGNAGTYGESEVSNTVAGLIPNDPDGAFNNDRPLASNFQRGVQRVICPFDPGSTEWTMTALLRPTGAGTVLQIDTPRGGTILPEIQISNATAGRYLIRVLASGVAVLFTTTATWAYGDRIHLALRARRPSSGAPGISLLVNGGLVGSTGTMFTTSSSGPIRVGIAEHAGSAIDPLPAVIDEVAFFGSALSDERIAAQVVAASLMDYQAKVLSLAPVAYWKMTETSGTVLTDSGPNALNGSYGTRAILGVVGVTRDGTSVNAKTDAGLNDVVASVPTSIPVQLTTPQWSALGWFRTSAADGTLLTKEQAGSTYPSFQVRVQLSGLQAELRKTNGATVSAYVRGSANVSDGLDHMWALTYDGANVRLYLDATLIAMDAMSGLIDNGSGAPVSIASTFSAGAYNTTALVGASGHISMHSTAIGADDIAALYALGRKS